MYNQPTQAGRQEEHARRYKRYQERVSNHIYVHMHNIMNIYDGIGYARITEPTRIIRNSILPVSNIVSTILITTSVIFYSLSLQNKSFLPVVNPNNHYKKKILYSKESFLFSSYIVRTQQQNTYHT